MLLQAAYTLSIFNNTVFVSPLQFLYCLSPTSMPQTVLSQFQCRWKFYLCDITSSVASRYIGVLWINYCSAFPALFPTFTDNPNCLCHYYQSTLKVYYYNCYYYFVINYRSDSTTQSPATK